MAEHTLSNQRNSSIPAGLFGDANTPPAAPPASIGDLTVSKSGESILFIPRDPQGNALPIAGIRSSDDVQVLQVAGITQASTCTLTFNGSTTTPIPLQPIPPLTSIIWRAKLPSAGSYLIGATWANFWGWPAGAHGSTQALFQVYGSGKLLGSATLDQSVFPGNNSDAPSDVAVAGAGVFREIGSFDFAGTDVEIHLSGPADAGLLLAGQIRLAPVGDNVPEHAGYIGAADWFPASLQGSLQGSGSTTRYGNWTYIWTYSALGQWQQGYYGMPTGTEGTGFPAASDVQQALSALPNILPESIKVSSPSNQSIAIQFTGLMGSKGWPSLVCSDSAVEVIHDGTAGSSIGGDHPIATINGVSYDLLSCSYAPGKPRMAFHLIQDAPTVQYQRYSEGLYQNLNWYSFETGIGFGGWVGYASQSGPLANWRFQGLAGPAEFQVDVTWPKADPNGDLLECAVLDGSGTVLLTAKGIDQSKAPLDSIDAAGVGWSSVGRCTLPLQVNSLTVQARGTGTPGKRVILDSVRLTRVSPDRGVKIRPGDQVLFHLPADFVRTSMGSVAAAPGIAVDPAPATRLPAIPDVPKSTKLGYNCDFPIFWSNDSCYANMAVQVQQRIGLAQDVAGNPTKLAADIYAGGGWATTVFIVNIGGGLGFGVPTCDGGVWVLQYVGSPWSSCRLESFDGMSDVVEITSRRVTDGRNNRRYYQITPKTPASPALQLRFQSTQSNDDGTYQCDISDVAVYPPDVDPDSPSRWRSGFLKKLRGVQCFRFMDMLATNEMNLSKFAHLPDQANFPLGYSSQTISVPIATIGPPEPDAYAEAGSGTVVRVTTKVPHGVDTGFLVGLRTSDGSSVGQVLSNVVDPKSGMTTATPRDPINPTDGYNGQSAINFCRVIDETTLQIGVESFGGPLARMTNTLTPANGVLFAEVAPHARAGADDIADLCIATGLEPWLNVPWLATDDCVRQLARVLARRLPAGRLVHVEYGNEPWNTAFMGFNHCVRMAKLLSLPDGPYYIPYYMIRMGQVHKIVRDVWAEQGRDPADVRRVCGVQQDYAAGTTAPCLDYAIANGISFDELSPASYYDNAPASGPVDDLLTREQLLDLFAMNVQQSDLPSQMASHLQSCRDALAKNPTATWLNDVVLANYEGGPGTMTTPTMTANLEARNHGVHRHPDFAEIELHHLQMLEDAGVKLFNIFSLYGTRATSQWGVYEGFQMEAGTGDATVDVANVDDFENLRAIKSETAAALMKWSAMIQQPTPPTPGTPTARVMTRNGTMRTYGMAAY